MRNARGFTLIELLVVIAIVAVLLVIAIPSYQSITVQDRMASEINDLNGDLQYARSEAITRGLPVTICASANPGAAAPACSNSNAWNTGWIVFTDLQNNQTFASGSGDTLLRMHAGFDGGDSLIATASANGTGAGSAIDAVTFNRMGGTANFGMFTLHDPKNTSAFTRCLQLTLDGANQIYNQVQNPGVCP